MDRSTSPGWSVACLQCTNYCCFFVLRQGTCDEPRRLPELFGLDPVTGKGHTRVDRPGRNGQATTFRRLDRAMLKGALEFRRKAFALSFGGWQSHPAAAVFQSLRTCWKTILNPGDRW